MEERPSCGKNLIRARWIGCPRSAVSCFWVWSVESTDAGQRPRKNCSGRRRMNSFGKFCAAKGNSMKGKNKRRGGAGDTSPQRDQKKPISSKRQTKHSSRSLDAIREQLHNWKEQHKTLLVETGAGVVTQAGVGILHELLSGKFAVQLAGSRSLLLLDDKWERYVKLNKGGKHSTLLASKKGPNAPWIRLSDDLGDHGDELLAEAREGDIQMALSHLTLWAQARALVIFGSGTKIGEVTFVGRLVGPRDNDSFLVVGDPESGLRRVGGQILPRSAEYVHVHREKDHVAIVLRSRDGDICAVFHGSGSPEDQMLTLQSRWKIDN
jgi:hypothetical protein